MADDPTEQTTANLLRNAAEQIRTLEAVNEYNLAVSAIDNDVLKHAVEVLQCAFGEMQDAVAYLRDAINNPSIRTNDEERKLCEEAGMRKVAQGETWYKTACMCSAPTVSTFVRADHFEMNAKLKAESELRDARVRRFDEKVANGWFDEAHMQRVEDQIGELDGLMSAMELRATGLDEIKKQAEAATERLNNGGTGLLGGVQKEQEDHHTGPEVDKPDKAAAK